MQYPCYTKNKSKEIHLYLIRKVKLLPLKVGIVANNFGLTENKRSVRPKSSIEFLTMQKDENSHQKVLKGHIRIVAIWKEVVSKDLQFLGIHADLVKEEGA